MAHSIDFFKDEVRNGFYIPTAIKQAWAAELDVLAEIDRICEKHDIKYFADWGTFLGAVRHGGYVPWDDDLDICMLRDDYERFRKVADKELPEHFVIHDFERKENHWLFLSRVVNNSKMCFELKYLDTHNNFPWLAGVDIFVKDYLFADDDKELRRDKDVMNIIAIADGIREGSINKQQVSAHLNEIKRRYHISLPGMYRTRDVAVALYKLAEQQMAKVKPDETDRVGQVFPWILKNGPDAAERKAFYESFIRLPFEDTTIPVPAAYNAVLASRYGNYNEIRKVWDGHDYPYFEGQKEDMEKLAGEKFPGFLFRAEMLKRPDVDNRRSLKNTSLRCLDELKALLKDAENILHGGTLDDFTQTVSDSQQLAAEYGTLVEQVKEEDRACTKKVVDALQAYCDALWNEYQAVNDGEEAESLPESRNALELVGKSIKEQIMERREILFLPTGAGEWNALKKYYDSSCDGNTDVFVVPMPVMKKSFMGEISMSDDEIEDSIHLDRYPEGIEYTDWKTYDTALHCPDVVYTENPYDGANPCLTVPPDFYAENLRKYAGKVIYVPIGDTAEFGKEDVNDQYNMKHYVAAPGVIYADEIHVQSENIKEQYIRVLSDFAGEDTESFWREKIIAGRSLYESEQAKDVVKRIIYCVGANELKEHRSVFSDALSERIDILKDTDENLAVSVMLYPDSRTEWRTVDKELSDEIFSTVDKAISDKDMELITLDHLSADRVASDYDAYYGSPSPLVPAFVVQGKPVMLANYGI
jgi:phosphorylcholine metabolism protein LicD